MGAAPAERYTHGHGEDVLANHRWRTAANSAAYLLPHLRPADRVLDVGCGPGTITLDLARSVPAGVVVGVDSSADAIAAAGALDPPADASVSFEVGDVYALDHPDDSFDVVHAHQVLQHLADPVAALVELRRVCRPGGLVAVRDADYAAMVWSPDSPALDRWRDVYRAVARRNGGEPDAGRHLLGWAQRAGLSDVTPSAGVWCFATPADRAWWGGTWAQRISASTLAEQAVAAGLADAAELHEVAAGWRRWVDDPAGWFAVIHGELLCRV